MTPECEHKLLHLLERITVALERIAPPSSERQRKPAVLGTATYAREEREKQELRDKMRGSNGKTSRISTP